LAVIIAAVPNGQNYCVARRGISHVATNVPMVTNCQKGIIQVQIREYFYHTKDIKATISRRNMLLDIKLRRIIGIRARKNSAVYMSRDIVGALVNVDSQIQKSTSNRIETRSRIVSIGVFHPFAGA